jgi:uncharacterized protein (TIGR04255 family)
MAKLPNAPLEEVIFEVRWTLQLAEDTTQMYDAGFELASGRLSTIVEKELPVYKRIVPSEFPEQLLFYKAVHQYWKAEQTWPVIQLGPGIFTVNCTEDWYDWGNNYFPFLQQAVRWLIQAYKQPLQFAFASLRYIDVMKVSDYGDLQNGWQDFIGRHFNMSYQNSFNTRGQQKQININQVFELEDGGSLQVQLSDGLRNNEPALVWQTAVLKKQSFTSDQLIQWADDSHAITHQLFEEMLKPETYASFSRTNKD